MSQEDDYNYLINSGFKFLSFRPRSRQEIEIFINNKSRKINPETSGNLVNKVLLRLDELGYINDLKFIDWWVQARSGSKPKGIRTVIFELRQKGVDQELIDQYLNKKNNEDYPHLSQLDLARKALSLRISTFNKLPHLRRKQKIYNYLYMKGFDSNVIMSIIDESIQKD